MKIIQRIIVASLFVCVFSCENKARVVKSDIKEEPVEEIYSDPVDDIVWGSSESLDLDESNLVDMQVEFTDFATPLAIGDQIVVPVECEVYPCQLPGDFGINKFYFGNLPDDVVPEPSMSLEAGSVVTLLYTGEDSTWLRILDEKGNVGWINSGVPCKQRQYSESESIIRKLWEKGCFDFAAFSPDRRIVAFHRWNYRFDADEGISVCERATGKELFVARADVGSKIGYAFSPDGKYFYYIGDDKALMQVDIKNRTQKFLGAPSTDGKEFLQSIYPLPDCENVLCGTYYEPWAMFNLKTGTWTYKKGGDFMWATSFAFSPDKKYIAGCAGNPTDICVWEMETKKIVWQKFREFGGELHYSEDGKTLYVVNGAGILSLNAMTGELISRIDIEFPYKYRIERCVVVPEKDRIVYAINVENPEKKDGIHSFAYLYVYELSTGKLVQAEHIEEDGKEIQNISVSSDGKYISICIQDGSCVNECHQVICAINLDKKAKDIPVIKRSPEEKKVRNFLSANSFDAGWWQLWLYPDGEYTLSARHDGTMTGNWILMKNEEGRYIVRFSKAGYGHNKQDETLYLRDENRVFLPGWLYVDPDYEDLDSSGALCDESEAVIRSNTPSPAWKTYDYKGETVIKYPGWGAKDAKALKVLENTKMRKWPSLDAYEVSMPYYDYKFGEHIEDRCVLFEGQTVHIIAATEQKETIDGKTAPWYLVYEDDHMECEDSEGELVWVFGGFSRVIDENDSK